MPNEYTDIINFISSEDIYILASITFIFFYGIIGLLNWSIIKPLKYMGIVNIIVGIIFIVLRLLPYSIALLLDNNLLEMLLPEIIKPLFISGIYILISGILMIVIYKVINKTKKN